VLPAKVMGAIIFVIVSVYAVSYIMNRPLRSSDRRLDVLFLALGGYVSGTSLIGAPLIMAVFGTHVAARQLRDTLFALWFILVTIKMAAFVWAGVDLQLAAQLWLFPCAAVGHVLGLRLHAYMQRADPKRFYRILGCVLLVASLGGLVSGALVRPQQPCEANCTTPGKRHDASEPSVAPASGRGQLPAPRSKDTIHTPRYTLNTFR
jgi:uncharacterized membrane protein YfcA